MRVRVSPSLFGFVAKWSRIRLLTGLTWVQIPPNPLVEYLTLINKDKYSTIWKTMKTKYDWNLIQKDHDDGMTWEQLREEHGVSFGALAKAKKRGVFLSRNISEALKLVPGKPHTEETKQKISQIRKEYLRQNPDKVPYKLNHYSKGSSYPEKYFEEWLKNNNISYEKEKPISVYRVDYLINNIALEIDGEQHYLDERIVLSNKYRDEYLNSIGIKTIRVRWSTYQKLSFEEKQEYLSSLLQQINNG